MCGNTSTLAYSPRRLVALAASGRGAGSSGGLDPSGGLSPQQPEPAGQPDPANRPDPSAFIRNLKTPMPLGRKVRLVVRNTAIKIKTRQGCCGNHGEPGC